MQRGGCLTNRHQRLSKSALTLLVKRHRDGVAMFQRLFLCLFGMHKRDRRRAVYDTHHVARAPCKYCGKQLEKGLNGRWKASRD